MEHGAHGAGAYGRRVMQVSWWFPQAAENDENVPGVSMAFRVLFTLLYPEVFLKKGLAERFGSERSSNGSYVWHTDFLDWLSTVCGCFW